MPIPTNLKQDQQRVTDRMNREFKALQDRYPEYFFDINVERQQVGRKSFYKCIIRAMDPKGPVNPTIAQA